MRIFSAKKKKENGCYYFGEAGEIPVGISLASFQQRENYQDRSHYHDKAYEFYFVIYGKIEILIDKEKVRLKPGQVLMLEPRERHKVNQVIEYPVAWLTLATLKDRRDKISLRQD